MKLFKVVTQHLYETVQEPSVTGEEVVRVILFWLKNPQLETIEDYQQVMVLLIELLQIIGKYYEIVSQDEELLKLLTEINDNVSTM